MKHGLTLTYAEYQYKWLGGTGRFCGVLGVHAKSLHTVAVFYLLIRFAALYVFEHNIAWTLFHGLLFVLKQVDVFCFFSPAVVVSFSYRTFSMLYCVLKNYH